MPTLLLYFAKSFHAEHQRRMKDGSMVTVQAYYDKRIKKAAQHAPDHNHSVNHLSEDDKQKFSNMHKEQHVAHYYEAHALNRKLDAEKQLLVTLERSAKRYEDAGDKKSVTIIHNKIIKLKQNIMRHERDLNRAKGIAEGIGKMKHAMVAGSGELKDDAGKAHAHYVRKLGERFKTKQIITIGTAAKNNTGAENENANPKEGDRNAEGLVFRDGRWHREDKIKSALDEFENNGGEAWQATKSQWVELMSGHFQSIGEKATKKDITDFEEAHKDQVKSAIDTGKTIPKEVLADYPEMKAETKEQKDARYAKAEKRLNSLIGQAAGESSKHNTLIDKLKAHAGDLDPNSPNYRYRDTGNIAGSRKELAATLIRSAGKTGQRLRSSDIDWDEIEQNPREAKELITKSNLFGAVDWEALKAGGMEPGAGFLIDRVYASVAKEPDDSSVFRKDYALGLETLRDRMEKCKTPDEVTTVLKDIKDEWQGVMMTAKDSDEYQVAKSIAKQAWDKSRSAKAEQDAMYKPVQALSNQLRTAKYEQEKRINRKWKPDPEIDARVKELTVKEETARNAYIDYLASRPELTSKKREFGGYVSYDNDLEWEYRQASNKAQAILDRVKAKNLLENPTTRAWASLGAKFQGVLNYRGYKGSDAFGKHVTTAKLGKITDWSWAEKDGRTVSVGKGATKKEVQFQLQVAETMERKGGKAIKADSTELLKTMFGLRDVQSGNWVLKDPASAAFHVQKSAEAFSDLGDILGIDTEKLAMNGRLALALGARGKGNAGFGGAARAHYEPVQRVINLTKMGGGGCLAHEWFHSLDNMAAEMETGTATTTDDYITENPSLLPEGKIKDAVINLRKAVLDGDIPVTTPIKYQAKDVSTGKYNFDNPRGKLAEKIRSAGNLDQAIKAIDTAYTGRNDKKSIKSANDWRRITAAYYDNKPEGGEVKIKTGATRSSFAHEAVNLDFGADGKYWSKTRELMARAFQSYTEDKLEGQNRKNDYLSSKADNKHYKHGLFGPVYPFPEGEERARINAAFDSLIEALRESGTLHKAFGLPHQPRRVLFLLKSAAMTRPVSSELATAAHQAATSPHNDLPEPTQAMKDAGNYRKGHVRLSGLNIAIENPKGSERKGVDSDGNAWATLMHDHYGYFKSSDGADDDPVDVFINPDIDPDFSGMVYVINQKYPDTGEFDEHKVMFGYGSIGDAKSAYLRNYQPGWDGIKSIATMPIDTFKDWLKDSNATKYPAVPVPMAAVFYDTSAPEVSKPRTKRILLLTGKTRLVA